jgi:hypothetical protein
MGRVVRGMGAMGWEGASDMTAADGGAIGRLGGSGGSGDGERRAMGGLAVGVDVGAAQRSLTSARSLGLA